MIRSQTAKIREEGGGGGGVLGKLNSWENFEKSLILKRDPSRYSNSFFPLGKKWQSKTKTGHRILVLSGSLERQTPVLTLLFSTILKSNEPIKSYSTAKSETLKKRDSKWIKLWVSHFRFQKQVLIPWNRFDELQNRYGHHWLCSESNQWISVYFPPPLFSDGG